MAAAQLDKLIPKIKPKVTTSSSQNKLIKANNNNAAKNKKEKPILSKMEFLQTKPYTPSKDIPFYDYEGRQIQRYTCDACADSFIFIGSLEQHINRRSVKITVKISGKDSTVLNFYNPCAQFYYFKNHSAPDLLSKETNVSPLMADEQDTFIDNILPNLAPKEVNGDISTKLVDGRKMVIKLKKNDSNTIEVTPKSSKQPSKKHAKTEPSKKFGKESVKESAEELVKGSIEESIEDSIKAPECKKEKKEKKEYKCNECGQTFSSLTSRKDHFLSVDSDHGPFLCETCSFWCPNACSLEAHQRLHSEASPHICPECGYHQEKSFKKLISHSIVKCQHLLRQLTYACSQCQSSFRNRNGLIEHITSHHAKQLSRCSTCNQQFESIDSFEKHKDSHPSEDGYRRDNLYQCTLCQKEVSSKLLYFAHIESHLKDSKDVFKFVFICPQCKERQCDSGSQVLVHLQAAHLLDLTKPDREASLIGDLCARYKIKYQTESSPLSPSQSPSATSHETNLKKTKFACEVCGLVANSWDDMADHGISKHIEGERLFVCLICSNKKFTRRNSLLAHLRRFHTASLVCPSQRCTSLKFSDQTDMYTHYRIKHKLLDLNSEGKETNKNGHARRHSDPQLPLKKIKLDKKQKQESQSPDTPASPEDESSTLSSEILRKSLINGSKGSTTLQCNQCEYQTEEADALRAHYMTHRTVKAPFMCFECGTNYVSYSSFECHLVSQHGINDCQDYVKINLPDLNTENIDDDDIDLLGIIHDESLNVSMCPVCSKLCSDAASLKSHVKVHGMAFIKSCQKNLNTSVTHDVA